MTSNEPSAYKEAIRIRDELEFMHKLLKQAHAAYAGVKKQADADNFPDGENVLRVLGQDIETKKEEIKDAEEALREVRCRQNLWERVSWWQLGLPEDLSEYERAVEDIAE
ncbi:hypothetical protein EKO04_011410 [Ascochyta lentis]|uniref:Uncharacterized protein n=1 Tax=Ascochyta lentis TaxID=205686 RepID=A0A8H7IUV1_9PLEO|nr:hypothetical protein EKO04_011410 [Ascochyta lentis]